MYKHNNTVTNNLQLDLNYAHYTHLADLRLYNLIITYVHNGFNNLFQYDELDKYETFTLHIATFINRRHSVTL